MKWYVFDLYDCFGSFNSANEAAVLAEDLNTDEMQGIHIMYMDEDEFEKYCKTGVFPFTRK